MRATFCVFLTLGFGACGGEPEYFEPTYANIEETVQLTCGASSSSCHGGVRANAMMNFERALADGVPLTELLVDVPACEYDLLDRVEPGDPERSWLWIKLTHAHAEDGRLLFEPDPAWVPGIEPRADGTYPPSICPNVEDGELTFGYAMPQNIGRPTPLPQNRLDLFREWIEAGAPGPE